MIIKNLLCFGDSNTFGYNPADASRYDENTRWPGILKHLLPGINIIEAGCNNRTCFRDNPLGNELTGYKVISEYLTKNIDFMILALGINDTQIKYNVTETDIQRGIEKIIEISKDINSDVKILLVSPSVINKSVLKHHYFSGLFDEESIEKSYLYSKIYGETAKKYNCLFLDLNKIADVSQIDGLHYDKESHLKIANVVCDIINKLK